MKSFTRLFIGDRQYLDRDYSLGDYPSGRRTLRKFSPTVGEWVGMRLGIGRGRKTAVELGDPKGDVRKTPRAASYIHVGKRWFPYHDGLYITEMYLRKYNRRFVIPSA